MHILGIDPGETGGLATLDGDTGQVVSLLPMPIVAKEFDVDTLFQVFQALPEGSRVIMEGVHAFPGQGVNSVWSFAEGVGIVKGLVRASQLPLEFVYPQTWQKMTCGPTGKDKAVTAAWAHARWMVSTSRSWCSRPLPALSPPLPKVYTPVPRSSCFLLLVSDIGHLYPGNL